MTAGEDGDPDEAQRDPGQPAGRERLVREEAEAEEDHEERHRRLGDRRDARVHVLLAPGDEPEGDRVRDHAEDGPLAPRGAQLGDGAASAHRHGEIAEQDDSRDRGTRAHERCRLKAALDGDLDEEVRRAPEGGEEDEQRPVATHLRTVVRRRTVPVASPVPARMSASPTSAEVVTGSSSRSAP